MDVVPKIVGKFKEYGYEIGESDAEKLKEYLNYLIEYNRKVNLTAITDEDGIIVKHFLDSLAAAEYLPRGARLADVGSGAGFPAVVLKIYRPDIEVTMFESNGKKVAFLNSLITRLGLTGIEAVNARVEDIGGKKEYRSSFDAVTARAVTETRILVEYAMPVLKTGGELIAYKAHYEDELPLALRAAKATGAAQKDIKEYSVEGQFRSLLRFVKVKETAEIYPRRYAKIIKEPL